MLLGGFLTVSRALQKVTAPDKREQEARQPNSLNASVVWERWQVRVALSISFKEEECLFMCRE
jgi:hypothetical protein